MQPIARTKPRNQLPVNDHKWSLTGREKASEGAVISSKKRKKRHLHLAMLLLPFMLNYVALPLYTLIAPTDHFAIVKGHDAVKWAWVSIEDHWQEIAITGPQ